MATTFDRLMVRDEEAILRHARGSRSHCRELDPVQVAEDFLDGQSIVKIAAHYDVSQRRVRNLLEALGFHPLNARVSRTLDSARIVQMHRDGMTIDGIARACHVRNRRIYEILCDAGVEIQSGPKWGSDHPRWKGGRSVEKRTGYVRVTLDRHDPLRPFADRRTGSMFEHRYVMAMALGRPLESWETVHHIDGVRSNNHISNLQLRVGQHGPGAILTCRNCGSHDIEHGGLPDGD